METETHLVWQEQNKHKHLEPPSSLSKNSSEPKRYDLVVEGSRGFYIDDFLSPEECKYYLEQSEQLGYDSLEKEFRKDYRNNERCSVHSKEVAEEWWKRIIPFLQEKDIDEIRPYGFGTKGTWKPEGLDIWFKFSKYKPGTFFKPHLDSPYVRNEDERSVFTLMVFLNTDFQGGYTNFFNFYDVGIDINHKPLFSIEPKLGRALIFTHDTRHEGEQVLEGVKYIMRTEIMFKRTSGVSTNWKTDKEYLQVVELFDKSEQYEKEGNVALSSECYLKAIQIQSKYRSVPKPELVASDTSTSPFSSLQKDLATFIFSSLAIKDLIAVMQVCKSWYKFATDGSIWKVRFAQKWPEVYKVEKELYSGNENFLKDWYSCYKKLHISLTKTRAVIFDFGSVFTKYSMVGSDIINFPVPNLVCDENRLHFTISGTGEDETVRVGYEYLFCYFPINVISPILKDNEITNTTGLLKLLKWIYSVGFLLEGDEPKYISGSLSGAYPRSLCDPKEKISPEEHPVIIVEPFEGYSDYARSQIKGIFSKLKVPFVHFHSPIDLVLMVSPCHSTGLIVSIGYKYTYIVAVVDNSIKSSNLVPFSSNNVGYPSSIVTQRNRSDKAGFNKANFSVSLDPKNVDASQLPFEIFFEPLPEANNLSLPESCFLFVKNQEDAVKAKLLSNIILCGSITETQNFDVRFEMEMKKLDGNAKVPPLLVPRSQATVYGGRIYGSLSSFRDKYLAQFNQN